MPVKIPSGILQVVMMFMLINTVTCNSTKYRNQIPADTNYLLPFLIILLIAILLVCCIIAFHKCCNEPSKSKSVGKKKPKRIQWYPGGVKKIKKAKKARKLDCSVGKQDGGSKGSTGNDGTTGGKISGGTSGTSGGGAKGDGHK